MLFRRLFTKFIGDSNNQRVTAPISKLKRCETSFLSCADVNQDEERSSKPRFSTVNNEGKLQLIFLDTSSPHNFGHDVMRALFFDDSKYDVITFSSQNAFLQYVMTCYVIPDLILIDIDVLDTDLCKIIRNHYSQMELPIILVGSSHFQTLLIESLRNGANDFVLKPLHQTELLVRIKTQLSLRDSHEKEALAQKNKHLLESILPAYIIDRLNRGETGFSDEHKSVTILFSDICGFTSMSNDLPINSVIDMLNDMFSRFDSLTIAHNVFKVETIGDAYMCVAGHDGSPHHAQKMFMMAIAMLKAISDMKPNYHHDINIRVGIHTGPARSGVVGRIRPRYCFFGDTVNTASRMESTGFPSSIQISNSTYNEISTTFADLQFVELHKDIKGKGRMVTYVYKNDI